MNCEVCGKRASTKAKIEGIVLDVCEACASHGQVISLPVPVVKKEIRRMPEFEYTIVDDFASIIKKNREKMHLTQEQLALKIGESSSLIKKIESGWEPPMNTIKKLERFFSVNLTTPTDTSNYKTKPDKKALTIGDMIEVD